MSVNNQEESDLFHPIKAAEWIFRIRASASEIGLRNDAAEFFRSVGFDIFRYQVVSFGRYQGNDHSGLNFSNLTSEWIAECETKGYSGYDPVLRRAESSARPFKCSEICPLISLSALQTEYIDRLNSMNLLDGWGIPVFGPFETIGCFLVGNQTGAVILTKQDMLVVQSVCQHIHLRIFELFDQKHTTIRLSERKVEILFWMSKGKSKRDIAQILNISVHTIDAYVRRIYVQLEVDNNVEAVVKAIKLNLIKN
jgi:DNA-binding CsgD family transcriptional regulator